MPATEFEGPGTLVVGVHRASRGALADRGEDVGPTSTDLAEGTAGEARRGGPGDPER